MFRSIRFHQFKSLSDYSVSFRPVNVLVGPNNAGKSTIVDALRALEGALRYARRRRPAPIRGPKGKMFWGYEIPINSLPITTINIHTDYGDEDSSVTFTAAIITRMKDKEEKKKIEKSEIRELVIETLRTCTDQHKSEVSSLTLVHHVRYLKGKSKKDDTTITKEVLENFESLWSDLERRTELVPGKEILAEFNTEIQKKLKVSLTVAGIIQHILPENIPADLRLILTAIDQLSVA